ncbi:hypothetical protein niasHT_027546 [Heterodera trifolii]|uniref:Sodium/potassium-transporting ATPase subunit beta n=1 Tax=Heterodera trifolii TaxID=157864 RepID=A0ABD2K530_9BILA
MTKTDNGKFTEENNTLMANGRTKPSEKTSLSTFIYNKQDGTFLGRSAKSWAQIIGFYIVFYIFLALFWMGCLWTFLNTIDDFVPRYHGENTIIGANPGVGYQPWLASNPESTLIKFYENDTSSYKDYLNAIDTFLEKYHNKENTRFCRDNGTESNSQYVKDGKVSSYKDVKACQFELGFLDDNGCGKKDDYGFNKGQPCVILTVNRLIGWEPEKYKSDADTPSEVRGKFRNGTAIAFSCKGISEADEQNLGPVKYIPDDGIHGRFYPYAKMMNYHQPFAVVKFTKLTYNRVVLVKCSAFANNIVQDEESKAGMVTFELLRQR